MALKGKRVQKETVIEKKIDVIAERGLIVAAEGADDDFVTVETVDGDTLAIGLLLDDVEDRDLTAFPANLHKNLAQVSGVVSLAIEGQYLTDQIDGGAAPAQGKDAYLIDGGQSSTSPKSRSS
jgi:hypothetical protein